MTVTTYWRDGHHRTNQYGNTHWVDGHTVARAVWDHPAGSRAAWRAGTSWTRRYLDEGVPNAACPECAQPVWFYRSPNGGCAYFDELGQPWPKHPCTDNRKIKDLTATWQAVAAYREEYGVDEPDDALAILQASYALWFEASEERRVTVSSLDLHLAERAAQRAYDEMFAPSRVSTAAAIRKKREAWTTARAEVDKLRTAQLETDEKRSQAYRQYVADLTMYHRAVAQTST